MACTADETDRNSVIGACVAVKQRVIGAVETGRQMRQRGDVNGCVGGECLKNVGVEGASMCVLKGQVCACTEQYLAEQQLTAELGRGM